MNAARKQDWPARLEGFLKNNAARPFSWGEWDCCLFAASWIFEATGQDFSGDYRGRYSDADSARALLSSHGFSGYYDLAVNYLGAPLPAVTKAQRGDVVLLRSAIGGGLGIVHLNGLTVAAITEKNGLSFFPLRAAAAHAWRV